MTALPTGHRGITDIRVLDFTWSVAGPTMTRYLAGLGATVYKVEWPLQPDPMRTAMYRSDTTDRTLNNGAFFANLNVGKMSVAINVRDERGLQAIRDLLPHVDVVAESFSAGVLERWGLGWEELRRINPDLIYVSISGFGHTGPHRAKSTWGPTAQAMSGITASAGIPGEEPSGWGWSYLDVSAGYFGAIGVLNALRRRQAGMGGSRIDMSQVETGLALAGPALTDHLSWNTPLPETYPPGNASVDADGRPVGHRGDAAVLSDLFPTSDGGDSAYVAITADADELAQVAELVGAASASTDDVHAALTRWSSARSKYDAADALQRAGIRAAPLQTGRDRVEQDPQLRDRDFLTDRPHPRLGYVSLQDLPFRVTRGAAWNFSDHWPMLGEHTEAVLAGVAGYSEQQIGELREAHVLWPEGLAREIAVGASLW